MDKDESLNAYDVTYRVEPSGSACAVTRTETREYVVGIIRYVKEAGRWKASFRDNCEEHEEFATIEDARSYLARRYEEAVNGEEK